MSGAGFDWLNIAGLSSDSNLPPPPVSFGVTPTSSTSSVNLVQQNGQQQQQQPQGNGVDFQRPVPPPPPSQSKSEDVLSKPTYIEDDEDLAVPLSLTIEQLTKDEAKTYLRWYNDIVVRKNTKLIRLSDVFNFLNNFNILDQNRSILEKIFRSCTSLNIGEFFALLRLISHTILGTGIPSRKLIKVPAPIPKPKSILSKKRMNDLENGDDDNDNEFMNKLTSNTGSDASKFDLDSFTQFILTGERPEERQKKKKKNGLSKRVKFSDEVSVEPSAEAAEPVNFDLTLPMDQLLGRYNKPKPQPSPESSGKINEDEELHEMKDQFDHFKNVKNVDSALVHGTPANIPSIFFDHEMGNSNNGSPRVSSPDPSSQFRLLSPNHTGPVRPLPPNHTGPVLSPGMLQPNTTGGGDMFLNSLLTNQSQHQQQAPPPPTMQPLQQQHTNGQLAPNYTGLNQSQLQPTMTGSLSSQMRQNFNPDYRAGSASPNLGNNLSVPQPPQSRQRSASSPIPFDPNSLHVPQQQQQQQQQQRAPSPITSSRSPPPPPPPRSRANTLSAPPPPPSRNSNPGPALPPKIPMNNSQSPSPSLYQQQQQGFNASPYGQRNDSVSSSTADILGDLKALQSEVDKIQYYR
ncbi:hypothetical protein BN7_4886 [Wickerhamomyces ciferrii]|uniref:Protein SCD5 n=1 Tax=Wickerhamomyces ciferrii (strain ATCC 14091 / BCRC 22168 / CBS 111 / JCM 3599 / NBRC 0793 / NRRL Y-1031 F-60-10) TaxID=1206466 RepID=K0KV49_WICCF|nr:uncharacterized protein BN7_4886 [Wickerhamomyces ciferrii]CCH45304.1 hypothetical protein BN7_4886 [Wickerhamomyces ciferrii]